MPSALGTAPLRAVFDTIREPLLILDARLRWCAANRAFHRTFHLGASATFSGFLDAVERMNGDAARLRAILKQVATHDTVLDDFEVTDDASPLGPRSLLLSARRLCEPGAPHPWVIVAVEDTTERRRLETEGLALTQRLEVANRDLDDVSFGVSYELQKTLHGVLTCVELLAKGSKRKHDPKAAALVHLAVDGATRMHELMNEVLAYTLLNHTIPVPEPVAADECLDEALRGLESAIRQSGTAVARAPLPRLVADRLQLTQVLQNLIGHAIRSAGGEPLRVEVSARTEGHGWTFTVRDNGVGIDPQHHDRIFRPFQIFDPSGTHPGDGLGLGLCKRIVERHGGRIWVESQAGAGAAFHFTVPQPPERLT